MRNLSSLGSGNTWRKFDEGALLCCLHLLQWRQYPVFRFLAPCGTEKQLTACSSEPLMQTVTLREAPYS